MDIAKKCWIDYGCIQRGHTCILCGQETTGKSVDTMEWCTEFYTHMKLQHPELDTPESLQIAISMMEDS